MQIVERVDAFPVPDIVMGVSSLLWMVGDNENGTQSAFVPFMLIFAEE